MTAFLEAIDAYLNSEALRNAVQSCLEPLCRAVARHESDLCCQTLQAEFVLWRNGTHATLADMQRAVGKAVDKALETEQNRECIESIIANEMTELCRAIQPSIVGICLRHGIAISSMTLIGNDWDWSQMLVVSGGELGKSFMYLYSHSPLEITVFDSMNILVDPAPMPFFGILNHGIAKAYRSNLPVTLRRIMSRERLDLHKVREDISGEFFDRMYGNKKESVIEEIRESVSAYVKGLAKKAEIAIQSGRDEL